MVPPALAYCNAIASSRKVSGMTVTLPSFMKSRFLSCPYCGHWGPEELPDAPTLGSVWVIKLRLAIYLQLLRLKAWRRTTHKY